MCELHFDVIKGFGQSITIQCWLGGLQLMLGLEPYDWENVQFF